MVTEMLIDMSVSSAEDAAGQWFLVSIQSFQGWSGGQYENDFERLLDSMSWSV